MRHLRGRVATAVGFYENYFFKKVLIAIRALLLVQYTANLLTVEEEDVCLCSKFKLVIQYLLRNCR